MNIIFGTTNKRKFEDIKRVIALNGINANVLSLKDIGWDRGQIVENGQTIEENSFIKAREIYDFCQEKGIVCTIITDDSGLFVDALGDVPGVKTESFAEDELKKNPSLPKYYPLYKLLYLLKDEQNRDAEYRCAVTLMKPDGSYRQFVEKTRGYIDYEISDPLDNPYFSSLFVVRDYRRPFCQLHEDELLNTYRHKAIKEAFECLTNDKSL